MRYARRKSVSMSENESKLQDVLGHNRFLRDSIQLLLTAARQVIKDQSPAQLGAAIDDLNDAVNAYDWSTQGASIPKEINDVCSDCLEPIHFGGICPVPHWDEK